jgi:hypothetical protein
VIFDAGGEFDNREFRNRLITWFIKPEPITVKNPGANAIVERMHKVLGDMLRTQLASQYAIENPVEDLLSAASYALHATDKMCDFIHDSTESRVIGTPISRIRVTRKRRPRDAKPTSQSVFATTLAK